MLNVEWISSGKAWPDHSFKRIPPSDGPEGPSQTLRMSWPTSVSKTMKWRLEKDGLEINNKDQRNNSKNSINSILQTGSHSLMFAVTMPNRLCCNYLIVLPVSASIIHVQWRLLSYGAGYPGDRILPDTAPVMWPPHSAAETPGETTQAQVNKM